MTEEEKFEERVRMIVRDEMEAEWDQVGGYEDQARKASFNMTKAVILATCDVVKRSFEGPGAEQTPQGRERGSEVGPNDPQPRNWHRGGGANPGGLNPR